MTDEGGKADDPELTEFQAAVCRVLAATTVGDVVTYAEVAQEAGHPGAARAVGQVLKTVEGLPWWRVVNANGRLIPHDPDRQAKLLAAEGVMCRNGKVITAG